MDLIPLLSEIEPSEYRGLFELSHDVILMADAAGNILDINHRGEQLTGYPQCELRRMNVFEHLIIPEDQPTIRRVIRDTFEGRDSEYAVRWKAKGGDTIRFDGVTVPRRSADGTIRSTFCTLRDVTEQERAAHQLAYQAHLLNRVNDAIIATNEQLIVTAWNRAAETLYGFSAEEVLGRNVRQVIRSEVTDAQVARLLAHLDEVDGDRVEIVHYRKDGQRIYVEGALIALRGEDGRVTGYVAVNRDITERKRAEQERAEWLAHEQHAREIADRQREELRVLAARLAQAEEAERKRFARELHDQIGQKLTALGIHLNVLRTISGKTLPHSARSRLDESLALVEAMSEDIRNIIFDLRPAVLDDDGVVAALHWYGEKFSKRTGIAVTVQAEDSTPRLPPDSETALFRVVQEALTNVARHAQATQVIISLVREPAITRITIADNGIGFDRDAIQHHARSRWGLINMRERVQAIGGDWRIESAPGRGTRILTELESKA